MVNCSRTFSTLACMAVMMTLHPRPVAADSASPNAQCIECHNKTTPNIVSDWKLSKHSGIGCQVRDLPRWRPHIGDRRCQGQRSPRRIPAPSATGRRWSNTRKGKHSMAWAAMKAMPTIHWQPMAMIEGAERLRRLPQDRPEDAGGDRGTARTAAAEFGAASCDSCHTRHTFSVEEARQPQACETCHMGFDHPQWEMYSSSKHGVRERAEAARGAARQAPPRPPARPATCRTAITTCAPRGDSSPCACRCRKTSSGPPTAPPFCRRWACSIRMANRPRWWTR